MPHNHREISAWCLHKNKRSNHTQLDKACLNKERTCGRSQTLETLGIVRGGGGSRALDLNTHPDPLRTLQINSYIGNLPQTQAFPYTPHHHALST